LADAQLHARRQGHHLPHARHAALTRINRLLDLHQEPQYNAARDPFAGKTTVAVRVENFEFAYGDNAPVLKVVILDEATSALDADTEARLHFALRDFLKERTTLIIAHRLSAVKPADRVYVFEDGQIAEHGAHDEPPRGGGLYSKSYGTLQRQ
jgi:ABC-type transport system involved in cytochrome bd biosynthesis fused ATPase/permease subunit